MQLYVSALSKGIYYYMMPSAVPVTLKTNYANTFWCTYCVSVIAASIAEVGKCAYKLTLIP